MDRRILALSIAAPFVLSVGPAFGQVYLQTEQATTYVPLAQRGVTTTPLNFSAVDDGNATLNLPFTFRYFGADQTSVWVSTNGVLQFGTATRPSFSNQEIPAARDGIIAAWWDDLIVPSTSGHARTAVIGTAPSRAFVIEVENWERFSLRGINDGAYQVWLYEGVDEAFEVHYDRTLTASENYTATVGYRSVDGTESGAFRPCGETDGDCDETDYATLTGRIVRVERVNQPELVGTFGSTQPRGALPGQTVSVPVTVQNIGPQPAVASEARLVLSADEQIDAGDLELARGEVLAIPREQSQTVTLSAAVPANVAATDGFLLLEVDSRDAVTETSETNNVTVSAMTFATAADVATVSVPAPAGGNPGDTMAVNFTMANVGVRRTGPMTVEIRASLDELFQSTDPVLGRATVTLSGASPQTFTVQTTLPAIPPARYRALVRLDPDNVITEFDERNNIALSVTPFPRGPDFVPTAIAGPPGVAAGDPVSFDVTIDNVGVAYTGPIDVAIKLSPDPLNDLSDPVIGTATVNLNGQASQTVVVDAVVPANVMGGLSYAIAILDPANRLPEISDGNNSFTSQQPIRLGPDFAVSAVAGPVIGNPGDAITVTTDIASLGVAYTGTLDYALYLSVDEVIDPQDATFGTFSVGVAGAGASDARTVTLPATAIGDLRFLARVDPMNRLSEADEQNNDFATTAVSEFGPDFRVFSVDYEPDELPQDGTLNYTATLFVDTNPFTGTVPYRVLLSRDGVLDPGDREIGSGTLAVSGVNSFPLSGSVDLSTLSPRVLPGDYEVLIEIDPANVITERREDNNDDNSFFDVTIQGPNLVASDLNSDDQAFIGRDYQVQVTVRNDGAVAATNVEYGYYFSFGGELVDGIRVGSGVIATVDANSEVDLVDSIALTSTLTPDTLRFGIVLDPRGRLDETLEIDNTLVRVGEVRLRTQVSDLTGEISVASTAAAAGESMAATILMRNVGFIDARSFTYAYVLIPSSGPDVPVARRTAQLDAGDVLRQIDVVDVPATVAPGAYRLGLVLDPDGVVDEVNEANNRIVGPPIELFAADLQIVTDVLPEARLGIEYGTDLRAVGGEFGRTWRLVGGRLPEGLTLLSTGRVTGTPSEDGLFTFIAEVASGARRSEKSLQVAVRIADIPLEVVQARLPLAILGQPYLGEVTAVGGQLPLTWVAEGLPAGLTIDDTGAITGVPEAIGEYEGRFTVSDMLGGEADAVLPLRVVDPGSPVRVAPTDLPVGILGMLYCSTAPVRLFAAGGLMPYTWAASGLPAGLTLSTTGELCGTPEELGRFAARVTVADAAGQFDAASVIVEVVPDDAVVIRTVALPAATPGAAYRAALEAASGAPPYEWAIDFGALPPGLVLETDGAIVGQSDEPGLYAFAARVKDANGGSALRALSIEVAHGMISDNGDGCRCVRPPSTNRGPLLVIGLLLFGFGWRRRQRG